MTLQSWLTRNLQTIRRMPYDLTRLISDEASTMVRVNEFMPQTPPDKIYQPTRPTKQELKILNILTRRTSQAEQDPSIATVMSGSELAAEARVLSGSLYPDLIQLERRGLLKAEWDTSATPRRVYSLTHSPSEIERLLSLQ